MVYEISIGSFRQIENLANRASRLLSDVGVHDASGMIADAKSLLGLMNLDISQPVKLVSEDERALRACKRAVIS